MGPPLFEALFLHELAGLVVYLPRALLLAVLEATFIPELTVGVVPLP